MSLEVFGNEGDVGPEGYVTEETAEEYMREAYLLGLLRMREMLARFVEQGGDSITAASLRANWNPEWGEDPKAVPDDWQISGWLKDALQFRPETAPY
jgi:hypothetical protein